MRLGPWRDSEQIAYLTPVPDAPPPSSTLISRCIDRARKEGFSEVVTGALAAREQPAFLACGFELAERLHLLSHDLVDLAGPPEIASVLRRASSDDIPAVLRLDATAFDDFWRLDRAGLGEALRATPHTWFRVADHGEGAVAYAVSGVAGPRGYLQRLAVDPTHHGTGLGRALTLDGLRWMRGQGAASALVNTQERNQGAFDLYRSVGFVAEAKGLAVLRRSVHDGDHA